MAREQAEANKVGGAPEASQLIDDPDPSESAGKETLKLKVESGTAVLARAK